MQDRRKAPRTTCNFEGTVHPVVGGVGTKVLIWRISPLGCSIVGPANLRVGGVCELYFSGQGFEIGVQAKIVSRGKGGNFGLKFLSVDKDTKKRLCDLCTTLSSQPASVPALEGKGASEPVAASAAPRGIKLFGETVPAAPPPQKTRERRRVPRYVSELVAAISNPATGSRSNVKVVTLSVLGGCVQGSELPAAGQSCEMSVEWEGEQLKMQAEIVWKHGNQAGITFAALDPETEQLLRQVCAGLRLQPMSPLPPEPQ
jgi:PilZ domain